MTSTGEYLERHEQSLLPSDRALRQIQVTIPPQSNSPIHLRGLLTEHAQSAAQRRARDSKAAAWPESLSPRWLCKLNLLQSTSHVFCYTLTYQVAVGVPGSGWDLWWGSHVSPHPFPLGGNANVKRAYRECLSWAGQMLLVKMTRKVLMLHNTATERKGQIRWRQLKLY